jgi:predicted nucleic acid-binding protein
MTRATYLLDSNVLSETARSSPNAAVLGWLKIQARLATSSVTLFEIAAGVEAATSERKRLFLEEWLASLLDGGLDVLPFDARAARAAAHLEADARRSGRPIETRDLFILATARAGDLHLATRNVRHFQGRGVLVVDPFVDGARTG